MISSMKRYQIGFTLIELMIVVAIVGILAAIAIPTFQTYAARAQVSEALELSSFIKSLVGDIAQESGTPANANSGSNGIPLASSITGKYVSNISVSGGTITVTMNPAGVNSTSSLIAGLTLTLSPSMNAGSMTWLCGGSIPEQYRPKAC